MSKTNPKVDGYIRKNSLWQDELQKLRMIILDSPLTEEVKWRAPCYTFENSNVVMMGSFKESCVLSFVKGTLLKDADGILVAPGKNTQSVRVIRFTNVQEIIAIEGVLKAYIAEAIEVERAGLKVEFKKTEEFDLPEELQATFDGDAAFKAAFEALTPGRQRGYILHFSSAKQSKTRTSRIEKCTKQIFSGKGLND